MLKESTAYEIFSRSLPAKINKKYTFASLILYGQIFRIKAALSELLFSLQISKTHGCGLAIHQLSLTVSLKPNKTAL